MGNSPGCSPGGTEFSGILVSWLTTVGTLAPADPVISSGLCGHTSHHTFLKNHKKEKEKLDVTGWEPVTQLSGAELSKFQGPSGL